MDVWNTYKEAKGVNNSLYGLFYKLIFF